MSVAKVVATSLLSVVGMWLFVAFALVPMYDLFCEWTGVTGRVTEQTTEVANTIDEDRSVLVQFAVQNHSNMAWDFEPNDLQITVHPGEQVQSSYFVQNTTPQFGVAQAISSISPYEASKYFRKIECFCFQQQPLAASDSQNMGLVFYLDPELPEDISEITLNYTLIDITEKLDQNQLAQLQRGEDS
jgi:cytochrome c oxidase assembly protein subunit 11